MSSNEENSGENRHLGLSADKRKLLLQRLNRTAKSDHSSTRGIPKRPSNAPTLASLGQARIWVQSDISENSPSNNITSSFEIQSAVDEGALEHALNRLISRHETLRSNYRLIDGEIVQQIHDVQTIELYTGKGINREEILELAHDFGRRSINLENGPLLSLGLFSCSNVHHVLILTIHDIIFDKWSLKLFWAEFSEFYAEATIRTKPQVPNIEISYSDFSHWQRQWLLDGEQKRQTDYWKVKLKDPPAPIPMPTDFPYPELVEDPGSLCRMKIPDTLAKELRQFSSANNASLFTTFLLAFNLALSRYAETDDLLVSSPVANRRKSETANLIGFFLNTLVLRFKHSPQTTILEALEETKLTVSEALDHQDLPTDLITEAIKPNRVAGRQPLFQTMFVFQREDEGTPKLSLANCEINPIFVETKTSKFELSLFVAESGNTFETIAEYRTDLFRKDTIERFLNIYQTILSSVVRTPNTKIENLCLITDEERSTLAAFEKGPKLSYELGHNVLSLIERHSRLDHPAIVSSSTVVTYKDLWLKSDATARSIIELGSKKNEPVAFILNRDCDAIVSLLGIIKAGSPYLAIETDLPDERIATVLANAEVKIAITSKSQSHRSPLSSVRTITPKDAQANTSNTPIPKFKSEQLAYVLYTSGSSGTPKGVAVTHKNLAASTNARIQYYGANPLRFLLIPNLSFDSSVAGLFWTLCTGGSLVFPTAKEVRNPDELCELAISNKVEATLCVPTLYTHLIDWDPKSLNSLSKVIVAGEPCPANLPQKHFKLLPHCRLFNEYGPTEATVWASVEELKLDEAESQKLNPSIGRPIPGVSIRILDRNRNLLPPGKIGELCIEGPTISPGYFRNRNLTEKHFFQSANGQVTYATGDLVSWTLDGKLSFHGRNDQQVKMRGYRIEIGEIEKTLVSLPEIHEAAVLAVQPPSQSNLDELIDLLPEKDITEAIDRISDVNDKSPRSRTISREHFELSFQPKTDTFIDPPRKAQRDWLVGQALAEITDDLERLDKIAPHFVSGKDHKIDSDLVDITQAELGHDEIMEDWQTPLMKAMAEYVSSPSNDILEIGFGRGVSADFIQTIGAKSHTIIEMNRPCIENYFNPWHTSWPDRNIKIIEGRWQDRLPELGSFDGILFHAFPMNEQEFMDYVLNSITFAEHAFAEMASHLKKGGSFTYLTTEIESLSRRHQRALFNHFSEISLKVIPIDVPNDTIDTWWADSMVAIKATK